jgi:hypothetical protein
VTRHSRRVSGSGAADEIDVLGIGGDAVLRGDLGDEELASRGSSCSEAAARMASSSARIAATTAASARPAARRVAGTSSSSRRFQ